ncbi:MAG: hypothetical protein HYS38_03165 [Acidobacteria bacterium]|nr:hypothetical protein [Acidobacteriota bacterium]
MLFRKPALPILSLVFLFQVTGPGSGSEMNWVPPNDSKLRWLAVADWEPAEGAFQTARVPKRWRDQFPEQTANAALAPAGVVLGVATNARTVALRISVPPRRESGQQQAQQGSGPPRPPVPSPTGFDVYRSGQFVKSVEPSKEAGVQELAVYDNPSGNNVELSILFPGGNSFLVNGVGFSSGSQYGPPRIAARPRVLFHGDSITQGTGTSHPRNTFVWVVCERLGCDPINLGFGGSAWGDKPVADYIASRQDWNVLVVAFGTNTYRRAQETPEQFGKTYDTFLSTIRATHPDVPILCITPLWRGADGTEEKNQAGYTHQQYRDAVTQVVKRRQASDSNLHLLEGKELVPQNLLNADQVHPNDEGAAKLAAAVATELKPLLRP